MSRRHRSRPYWQNNVLHVPTSPFMSPIQSPVASPTSVTEQENAPDAYVASAILASLNQSTNNILSVDDLIASMDASRGEIPSDNALGENRENSNEEAAEGTQENPIEIDDETNETLDEEESEQFHLNQSVQRAYENFLQQLGGHTGQLMNTQSRESNSMHERRPQHLSVITNRRPGVVLRLPNGGYTFSPQSPTEMSEWPTQRGRRRSTRHISSSATRPIIRQIVTLRDNRRRNAARGRIIRYTRHMPNLIPNPNFTHLVSNAAPLASRHVSSFVLAQDMGVPEDKCCAICLEDYKIGDRVSYVACQPQNSGVKDHMFHKECIESWINSLLDNGSRERTCPVCRGTF